jgi:transcriptional regulator with XRE-family HTH domain
MVLRTARERLSLSQREFARRLGASPGMVANVEAGQRRPSVELLWRLAVELRLSPGEVVQALGELVGAPAEEITEARLRAPSASRAAVRGAA